MFSFDVLRRFRAVGVLESPAKSGPMFSPCHLGIWNVQSQRLTRRLVFPCNVCIDRPVSRHFPSPPQRQCTCWLSWPLAAQLHTYPGRLDFTRFLGSFYAFALLVFILQVCCGPFILWLYKSVSRCHRRCLWRLFRIELRRSPQGPRNVGKAKPANHVSMSALLMLHDLLERLQNIGTLRASHLDTLPCACQMEPLTI